MDEEKIEKFHFWDHTARDCTMDRSLEIEPATITIYGVFIRKYRVKGTDFIVVRNEKFENQEPEEQRLWYIIQSAIIEPESYKNRQT